ncbi:hypothetical protein AB0L05_32350 [Nonomuraea pusilla]|uniref:hypothetical protein n=1 Tax=Nonomuraea pusilla TaxID=46177 RepID=UPI003320D545
MSADARRRPLFEVVSGDDGVPEPITLRTADGTLSVAADLTAEEFELLDELRRATAEPRERD